MFWCTRSQIRLPSNLFSTMDIHAIKYTFRSGAISESISKTGDLFTPVTTPAAGTASHNSGWYAVRRFSPNTIVPCSNSGGVSAFTLVTSSRSRRSTGQWPSSSSSIVIAIDNERNSGYHSVGPYRQAWHLPVAVRSVGVEKKR